jgi:hypothetical protein
MRSVCVRLQRQDRLHNRARSEMISVVCLTDAESLKRSDETVPMLLQQLPSPSQDMLATTASLETRAQ